MRKLIKTFKALSDESRLRALNLLLERECCVCEVMQTLDISQSKASRILSTLYDAGFLKLRKNGPWSLYSIDWEGMEAYLNDMLKATTKAFKGNKQMEIDRERLKKTQRLGQSCIEKMCTEKVVW